MVAIYENPERSKIRCSVQKAVYSIEIEHPFDNFCVLGYSVDDGYDEVVVSHSQEHVGIS